MSEYGLKIKNIEAATLYEYNIGIRDHYDYKDAMFVNSLFKDFLDANGLKSYNEDSTRDIICLEFNFGTRTYEEEIAHLKKIAKNARQEYKLEKSRGVAAHIERSKNKRKKIASLFVKAGENKDLYAKVSKDAIRKLFYNDGVNVEYITRKKNGDIKKREVIHYKMLYRSTGKAKKGSCMFICDRLYKRAKDFLYMGIKLKKNNAPIVEISAYAPLVSSGIVGRVKINPKNILILQDVDRYFNTNVISIETDEEKHCHAIKRDDYKLKNTLFDGQALIDSSIFPDWGDGYILLRHHFCKMAAFSANIQTFFKDYYGDDYATATVKDMFGNDHYVKDIELITTDNAMKWLKFDITYEYWCDKVYENNCMFGIVKTAHESKLGNVQKMSYQMVNSLDESIMDNVMKESIDYIRKLKDDPDVFLDYLRKNSNFSNDYEVLVALCEQNRDFLKCDYFKHRKDRIITSYVKNLKNGKLIQDADNLVIVGSPYAMLLYGATGVEENVDLDDTLNIETNTIQCHTNRFKPGEYLAFFRSPFNSKNNLTYLHNVYDERFDKYMNLGRQCIAINMIGTDFQDRNNGSDQDSDSGYTTNQKDIVEHARKCYLNYPTIVNNIPKEKNIYSNTMDDYSMLDSKLAASQLDIGLSSNMAQIAQTYTRNFSDDKYDEYVCILSVIAQVSIDSAKRLFDISVADELDYIKKDMNIAENKYPRFWLGIHREFNRKNINKDLICPMNSLYDIKAPRSEKKGETLPFSYFFKKYDLGMSRKVGKKIEALITRYSLKVYDFNQSSDCDDREEDYLLLRKDFDDMLNDVRMINISKNNIGLMSWLIDRSFILTPNVKSNYKLLSSIKKTKMNLLKVLYEVNSANLLKCLSNNC